MKCKIIIGLSAILYFTGCYNREQTPRLSEAEKLMQNNPDSALAILQKLKPEGNRAEQARYALLYSEALEKKQMKVTDDSLIRQAWQYYKHYPKDLRHQCKTLYYWGRIKLRTGDKPGALRLFLKIEKKLTDTDESYYKGLLYRQIGEVYYKQMNYSRAYHYFHEARNNFRQSGDIQEETKATLDMAAATFHSKDIEKAIEKLKLQEKRLVDLYLSSNLDVETINHKNDVIKKEIDKLNQKKVRLDPDNNSKEYTIELVKKLDCSEKNNTLFFTNIKNIGFAFLYDLLSREAKRDMIHRLISMIEIKRDKNYNIDIKDIKFTDEFITKSSKEYLKYLNTIMNDNNIGIKFHKEIDEIELKNMESNYDILSIMKIKNKEYSNKFLEEFITKSQEHLYIDGIVSCPYTEKKCY